jgi:hypothetical protein
MYESCIKFVSFVQHFVFFVVKKYRDHEAHKEKYSTKDTKT